jgi:hypothetical protein
VLIDSLRCRFRHACLQGRWRHLAIGPNGAVLEIFLLPDRNSAFQGVDGEAAGVERGRSVGRTDGYEHARLSDFESPQTMRDGDMVNREFLVDLPGNFADFGQCHGFVGFVVQIERGTSMGMIANAAVEGNDSAVFGGTDMPDQGCLIDRVAHQHKKVGL